MADTSKCHECGAFVDEDGYAFNCLGTCDRPSAEADDGHELDFNVTRLPIPEPDDDSMEIWDYP
jgi:hypothetical protein